MNLTDQIIERVFRLQEKGIDATAYHEAKRVLLDYCGVVLKGAEINKYKYTDYLKIRDINEKEVTLFGANISTDLFSAILFNSMNAHVLELDDGHRFGMMHMGAPIISAVLNVAEKKDIDGEKQLKSIVIGYEIAITLSRHMQPGHKIRGYHATGTCCTVGTAIAIASLLEYDRTQIKSALSAAATSAAGLLEVIDDGSELKPYNVGRAAVDGVYASLVAYTGLKGPNDIIGGKRGFYSVLSQKEDFERIKNTYLFKNDLAISEIYFKPYAACRHCHPAIEAAMNIRNEIISKNGEITGIETIVVRTYKLAIIGHDHIKILGVSSAKMSTPYTLCAALLCGKVGINAYDDEVFTIISNTMRKVTMVEDEELNKLNPQKRVAIVEVYLTSGECYRSEVDYPKGEPENPITDSELESKLYDLAIGYNNEEIINCVWNYEKKYRELPFLLR